MSTSSGKSKVDRIRQVVLLKQMLKKWRTLSLSGHAHITIAPSGGHQQQQEPPSRRPSKTPAGCLAVYVGSERRRFVIPTRYLNLPVFGGLLQQSEEEFGYQSTGALVFPCDVSFFTGLLRALAKKEKAFGCLPLDDALRLLTPDSATASSSLCSHPYTSFASHSAKGFHTPLLQKSRA